MPHVPDIRAGKACHRRRSAYGRRRGQPSIIRGGSRMQESCTYGSVQGCALKAHETMSSEMATAVKLSRQPRTESCVVSGNGLCEA